MQAAVQLMGYHNMIAEQLRILFCRLNDNFNRNIVFINQQFDTVIAHLEGLLRGTVQLLGAGLACVAGSALSEFIVVAWNFTSTWTVFPDIAFSAELLLNASHLSCKESTYCANSADAITTHASCHFSCIGAQGTAASHAQKGSACHITQSVWIKLTLRSELLIAFWSLSWWIKEGEGIGTDQTLPLLFKH